MAEKNWRDFVDIGPSSGGDADAQSKETPPSGPSIDTWRDYVDITKPTPAPRISASATTDASLPTGKPGTRGSQLPFDVNSPISITVPRRSTPGSALVSDPISAAGPVPPTPEYTPEEQEWFNLPFFSRLGAVSSNFGRAMPVLGPFVPESPYADLFQRARPTRARIGRFLGGAAPYAAIAATFPGSMLTLPRAAVVGGGGEGLNDAIMSMLSGSSTSEIASDAAFGAGRGALSTIPGFALGRVMSPRSLARATGSQQGRTTDLIDRVNEVTQRELAMLSAYRGGVPVSGQEATEAYFRNYSILSSDPRNIPGPISSYFNNTRLSDEARAMLMALSVGAQEISPDVADTITGNIGDAISQGVQELPLNTLTGK